MALGKQKAPVSGETNAAHAAHALIFQVTAGSILPGDPWK